jgi:hypothetical protein
VLLSSPEDNSKNSVTLAYSPDSKKKNSNSISISKNSNDNKSNSNNSKQSNKLTNNNVNNTITNSENSKAQSIISNKSNKTSSKENSKNTGSFLKDIIKKRKLIILKSKDAKKEDTNTNISISELEDNVDILDNRIYSTTNKGLKITNITNIIVNKIGNMQSMQNNLQNMQGITQSMQIKTGDKMLRDMKSLHHITQKALTTKSKHNPVDSIDDERKSFLQFQNISSKKALFIDDNSDMPCGIGKISNTLENEQGNRYNSLEHSNSFTFTNRSPRSEVMKKHIINIININNNYNIGNLNYTNNYVQQGNPNTSARSNLSSKTAANFNLRKMIPKDKTSKTIQDIIKSCKPDNKLKDRFIKLTK